MNFLVIARHGGGPSAGLRVCLHKAQCWCWRPEDVTEGYHAHGPLWAALFTPQIYGSATVRGDANAASVAFMNTPPSRNFGEMNTPAARRRCRRTARRGGGALAVASHSDGKGDLNAVLALPRRYMPKNC